MTQSNPEQAAMLLQQNPQIAYAVLQALVQMNLVDPFSMQRILQAQSISNLQDSVPGYQVPLQQIPVQPIIPVGNPQMAAQQVSQFNSSN
jgi:hypothetical protein